MRHIRVICERLIWLLIAVLVAEHFILLGLFRPLVVDSGSMAETIKGPHFRVQCGDCRLEFACDATRPPPSGFATCPLCGNAQNKLGDKIFPGERLFVDRTAFFFRPPRRWELAVFRDPESGNLTVKRIVGLPGESLSIRDGEIFVNGERVIPPQAVRDATKILVFDSSRNPWAKWPPERVLDNLGYNQTESRRLNEVRSFWKVASDDRTQVFRDVYYTDVPRAGTGRPPERFDLGDNEFFVLGDNSPISVDSRHWRVPGLPGGLIVGKPLLRQ